MKVGEELPEWNSSALSLEDNPHCVGIELKFLFSGDIFLKFIFACSSTYFQGYLY